MPLEHPPSPLVSLPGGCELSPAGTAPSWCLFHHPPASSASPRQRRKSDELRLVGLLIPAPTGAAAAGRGREKQENGEKWSAPVSVRLGTEHSGHCIPWQMDICIYSFCHPSERQRNACCMLVICFPTGLRFTNISSVLSSCK